MTYDEAKEWAEISIHAPARGATGCGRFKGAGQRTISIHAPARGATLVGFIMLPPFIISIHAPARGATRFLGRPHRRVWISIHAPARGATRNIKATSYAAILFQSTHPRGVRPNNWALWWQFKEISIHAPARGATLSAAVSYWIDKISIHAPARGATKRRYLLVPRDDNFNPRTREGCDRRRDRGRT